MSGKGAMEVGALDEQLRLSKTQLGNAGYRDRLAEELFKLGVEAADLLKTNPAFPNLIVPIEISLKV